MKKIMVIAAFLIFMIASAAEAQRTPRVNERQQDQRTRIQNGVTSGEVTRAEAARLRAEQRQIRRAERRAKADGKVSREERERLHRKQNKASRDIRRQKHDAEDRN